MRRAVVLLACAALLAVVAAADAVAHPLGNFTVNHLTEVAVTRDAVQLRYILDIAEIRPSRPANRHCSAPARRSPAGSP